MLKNIPAILSPELLKILCEMGHGDEIVIADGNFPSGSIAKRLIRADGINAPDMLRAVLTVIPLDQYDDNNFGLMSVCEGDKGMEDKLVSVDGMKIPLIQKEYLDILKKHESQAKATYIERFAYYERAKKAYAVIATGELAQYANIILKKGCVIS